MSVVSWLMQDHGWTFDQQQGSTGDHLDALQYLHQRYTQDDPHYTGRVTVPVLWDKKEKRIVNNESSEIIRIFNSAFNKLTGNTLDLYPEPLRPTIEALNERIYPAVNNGVYRAGFATTQDAYEAAFDDVFNELDHLEQLLGRNRYLAGEYLTEADVRLFTTLVRFDAVYHGHFKCNLRRLSDYHNLSNWLRELYQWPGVASTVDMEHIQKHYYMSHKTINPNGIVPKGPLQDFNKPHDRERLAGKGSIRLEIAGAAKRPQRFQLFCEPSNQASLSRSCTTSPTITKVGACTSCRATSSGKSARVPVNTR